MWTLFASIGVVAAIAAVLIALRTNAEAKRAHNEVKYGAKRRD